MSHPGYLKMGLDESRESQNFGVSLPPSHSIGLVGPELRRCEGQS